MNSREDQRRRAHAHQPPAGRLAQASPRAAATLRPVAASLSNVRCPHTPHVVPPRIILAAPTAGRMMSPAKGLSASITVQPRMLTSMASTVAVVPPPMRPCGSRPVPATPKPMAAAGVVQRAEQKGDDYFSRTGTADQVKRAKHKAGLTGRQAHGLGKSGVSGISSKAKTYEKKLAPVLADIVEKDRKEGWERKHQEESSEGRSQARNEAKMHARPEAKVPSEKLDIMGARRKAALYANNKGGDISQRQAHFVQYMSEWGNLGKKKEVYQRWAVEHVNGNVLAPEPERKTT